MLTVKTPILKTAMSVILIVVISFSSKAQNNTNFLKNYYKFSVFGQYTVEKKGVVYKEDPSVNYGLEQYVVQHIGVSYNVYQHKNWNFKTGLIYKYKLIKEKYNFTQEQILYQNNYSFIATIDSGSRMYAIPLTAEYIVSISKRIKWEIAPSFTVAYYIGQEGGSVHSFDIDKPNPPTMLIYYDEYYKNPIFSSAEISTGFYILFKYFMLQPEFRYSKSFRDVFTGHYTVENFKTEPHNSKGTFKQSGDYWGFSLSIYLKKFNFKKK
jgi:hypothetical protein